MNSAQHQEMRESFDVRDLSCDGIFPDGPFPALRPVLTQFCTELGNLGGQLLKCIAVSLGLGVDALLDVTQGLDMGKSTNFKAGGIYFIFQRVGEGWGG